MVSSLHQHLEGSLDRRCDGSHSLHVQDIAGNMRITVQAAPDGGGLTAKLRFLRGEPLCMTTLCITQRTCPGRDYLVREGEDGLEIKPDLHLGIGCNGSKAPLFFPSERQTSSDGSSLVLYRDQYRVRFPALPLYSVPLAHQMPFRFEAGSVSSTAN